MNTEKHYIKKDNDIICFELKSPYYVTIDNKKYNRTEARKKWLEYLQLRYKQGDSYWYKNSNLHRDNDIPAVIYADRSKEWYTNGKLHRDNNLPAVINANGSKEWCINGKRHRDNDMPARIYSNGHKEWWINGKRIK